MANKPNAFDDMVGTLRGAGREAEETPEDDAVETTQDAIDNVTFDHAKHFMRALDGAKFDRLNDKLIHLFQEEGVAVRDSLAYLTYFVASVALNQTAGFQPPFGITPEDFSQMIGEGYAATLSRFVQELSGVRPGIERVGGHVEVFELDPDNPQEFFDKLKARGIEPPPGLQEVLQRGGFVARHNDDPGPESN